MTNGHHLQPRSMAAAQYRQAPEDGCPPAACDVDETDISQAVCTFPLRSAAGLCSIVWHLTGMARRQVAWSSLYM
ncbi:MAG: hypothetical protein IJ083_09895 [Clostridia bacterium]|nr:hypothetical protein [Clostridia bacterium]